MSQSKTPKIRFPEFTEEWQKRRLDEIFTERKESCVISEEFPQLAFTIAEGVINPEDKKTNKRDFLIKDIDTKKFAVTEVDDIIYNPANLKFGAIHRNKLKRGGVSPIYAIFSTEQSPAFMEYLVKRPSFIQESLKYLEGTVIKLMTLKPRDFLLMKTYIPSISEQKKIAELFTTLDNYIEIENKKTESYKTLKASMLQKMFPQQGSLEPEIRFPGFTEPWEQRKLGEMGSTYTGLSGKTKEDFGHGEAKFITYMNVFSNPVADLQMTESVEIDSKQNCVQAGDVFFTTSSETPEEVGMSCVMPESTENIYLNSFCFGYRPNEKFDLYYLAYVLRAESFRKEMTFLAQGISRYNISKNKVMEVEIPVPSLNEQGKVGQYFSNLDHLITLHQRKCEQLQLLKRALQQKMFV